MDFSAFAGHLFGQLGGYALALGCLVVIWRRMTAQDAECRRCREAHAAELRTEHEARLAELRESAMENRRAALEMTRVIDRLSPWTSGRSRPG